ncbi:MAG: hypothetical protein BroJett026_03320 [Betaproteobacteria bacterium]|nr:MAG: hypothetical protein BroJett026_03320 [Betaproteobacteria bacterium]
MTHEHVLRGCTPTPLASYLKALAVLRLVAEQAGDPEATGCWRDDVFVLRTRLSEDDLLRFLLEQYEPTPLVAPWNGGSGFFPKDNQDGIRPIEASNCKRFSDYRRVIEAARSAVAANSFKESPKEDQKISFLQALRNQAPEALLRWIDAAVILSDDNPRYPPLLGTGGNDGRLDFTNNFMQRLGEVFDVGTGGPKPEAAGLLRTALLGTPAPALLDRAIGQFAPGNAGGPNASSGFEGNARINPWDFILMLEGALLLCASAARRLESSSGAVLSAPFTVRSRLSTEGAATGSDDGDARGEIWMPLWSDFLVIEEVTALFGEGRAALGTRPARDGLDFARAVARLGVDRGIRSFQRFGFLMRSGKAFLATPLARVAVRRNPDADLIDDLERRDWLGQVQRYARDDKAPGAFRAAAARLDAALFALTQRADRVAVQQVLRHLGRIEALCATSSKTREAIRQPVPRLSPDWARRADDGSAEFRIAAALAGLSMRGERDSRSVQLTLRPHLAPVTLDGATWEEGSSLVCWGPGEIERNLSAVLHRRRLEAHRLGAEDELLKSTIGARLIDVQRFIEGDTDDRRIAELLAGLVCADLGAIETPRDDTPAPLPAYALLKVLFTPESTLRRLHWLPTDRDLRLPAEIPARLVANDINTALALAWQRLRALGARLPSYWPPQAIAIDGPRLLAALTIPLTLAETGRLLRWLDLAPETEPLSEPTVQNPA